MEHTTLSTAANKKNWPSSQIKLCQKSHNWTQSAIDKISACTVSVSWFSAIKRSDGIQLFLMNSYQIPEAMLFWPPQWEAACRRVFLYVQNDKTLQIVLYLTVFSASASLFHSNCFPSLPFLHKLTRSKFARVLLFIICLQLQMNTH